MRTSLRRRLMWLLSGAVLLAWIATAWFSYSDARAQIGAMLDGQLRLSAELIAQQRAPEMAPAGAASVAQGGPDARLAYQVWDGQALLRQRSANAPRTRLSAANQGFSEIDLEGKRWRVYSHAVPDGRVVVQVAERHALRDELAQSVANHLMHPLAVALPVLGLLIWFSVSAGLLPLGALASQLQRRAPDNLAPLPEPQVPREVAPLVHALNALFERLRSSFEQERRFTADAAHELRTPLAALKTQAQVAQAAASQQELRHALDRIVLGVDRATHLVEQLLMLARLDPQASLPEAVPVSLPQLAATCIAQLASMAADKDVDLAREASQEALIRGDATLLAALLRNLLDNAIRHAPPGTEVEVGVAATPTGVVLRVSDHGPGIPQHERQRVLDRFYRVGGVSGEGSGLGLSIVRRIVELHGGTMGLRSGPSGRGLTVEVLFPASSAGAASELDLPTV